MLEDMLALANSVC